QYSSTVRSRARSASRENTDRSRRPSWTMSTSRSAGPSASLAATSSPSIATTASSSGGGAPSSTSGAGSSPRSTAEIYGRASSSTSTRWVASDQVGSPTASAALGPAARR